MLILSLKPLGLILHIFQKKLGQSLLSKLRAGAENPPHTSENNPATRNNVKLFSWA